MCPNCEGKCRTAGSVAISLNDNLRRACDLIAAKPPVAIVKRLSDEVAQVVNSTEVKTVLDSSASFAIGMPQEAFHANVAREAVTWTEVIRKFGASPE